jgi:hypothetical protein
LVLSIQPIQHCLAAPSGLSILEPRSFQHHLEARLAPSIRLIQPSLADQLDQYSLLAQWGQLHLPNHSTRQRQSAPYSRLDLSPQLILRSLEHQLDQWIRSGL